MDEIADWERDNKITFNEEKSKVILLTRRKRREQTKVAVYLKNKAIPEVQKLKYLGIIYDNKLTIRVNKLYSREMHQTNICTN